MMSAGSDGTLRGFPDTWEQHGFRDLNQELPTRVSSLHLLERCGGASPGLEDTARVGLPTGVMLTHYIKTQSGHTFVPAPPKTDNRRMRRVYKTPNEAERNSVVLFAASAAQKGRARKQRVGCLKGESRQQPAPDETSLTHPLPLTAEDI